MKMDFKLPRHTVHTGPEALGARRLRQYMLKEGWHIEKLHGNKYQSGLPDLLCIHPRHGLRWIETKAPGGKLTGSQVTKFYKFKKYGQQIYVLENETHYHRLFDDVGNWERYIR